MGCRIETGWQGSLLVLMDYCCSFVMPFAVLNTVVGVAYVAAGLCMLRNGFGVMNFNHWDFSSGDESERHNRCRHKTKPKGDSQCNNKEDNFWETLPALDDIVTTNHPSAKIIEPRKPNLEFPGNIVSETRGETLIKDDNPELKVYVRKKFHKGGARPIVSPVEIQSDLPSEGPTNNLSSSSSSGNPSYSFNDLPDLSFPDINLPISVIKKFLTSMSQLLRGKVLNYSGSIK
ncbi:hypothetical protein KIW84_050395 [Lathyrus oleraceus]|uniref:Uncharacterized protein n=1 Tax=Pisum sativum TaxID=3888 RepID=A0A9D5ACD0_PEA|nr:hypothetical protein KIW84_050395 [Pisum sativum]